MAATIIVGGVPRLVSDHLCFVSRGARAGCEMRSSLVAEMDTFYRALLALTATLKGRDLYLNEGLAAVYWTSGGITRFVEVVSAPGRRFIVRSWHGRRADMEVNAPADLSRPEFMAAHFSGA